MRRCTLLVGFILGFANIASASLPGIPVSVATAWLDDSGNATTTVRSWGDTNSNSSPDCSITNPLANNECGAINQVRPLPERQFHIGVDPGPGGGTTLIYPPGSAPGAPVTPVVAGDVIVDEGPGVPPLIIRFNGDDNTIVVYSGTQPASFYANVVTFPAFGEFTPYIPGQGQPGYGYTIVTSAPTCINGCVANFLTYVFRLPTRVVTDARYLQLSGGTLTGDLTAPNFSGNGSGLTSLNPANLSAGTAGINITGNAATATSAASASFASSAADASLLGGVSPANYARRDIGNTFAGAQSVNGSLAIGGGTAITQHLSATYGISLPSLKPNTCTNFTETLTGAVSGANDTVALGIPNSLMTVGGFLMFQAWESATDTLAIRVCNVNPSGPASKGVSDTVRVDLWKH
jgi:hypothetical protein